MTTQSVFEVGDPITSRLKLGVTPDGTTTVTVAVTKPNGANLTGLIVSGFGGVDLDEKTVQWYATDDGTVGGPITEAVSVGDWVAVWRVTGTGASVTPKVYSVAPLPTNTTRPRWMPFLSDVADYVPELTLNTVIPGGKTFMGTFTGDTWPTDEQARRHVNRVAELIQDRWPALPTTLYRTARSYVTLRAAANILRAFARTNDEREQAARLTQEADAMWAEFVTAADDQTTGDPAAVGQVPIWAFPEPAAHGDLYL